MLKSCSQEIGSILSIFYRILQRKKSTRESSIKSEPMTRQAIGSMLVPKATLWVKNYINDMKAMTD